MGTVYPFGQDQKNYFSGIKDRKVYKEMTGSAKV